MKIATVRISCSDGGSLVLSCIHVDVNTYKHVPMYSCVHEDMDSPVNFLCCQGHLNKPLSGKTKIIQVFS